MTMPVDLPAVARVHLETKLTGNSAITDIIGQDPTGAFQVFYWLAEHGTAPAPTPFGVPPPRITINPQDGGGVNTDALESTDPLVAGEFLWTVKITGQIDPANPLNLEQLNALIYQTLHGSSGEYPSIGGRAISCVLDSWLIQTPSIIDGVRWDYRGGLYRITAQPLT